MYDLLGIEPAERVKGVTQKPLEGTSFAAPLLDPADSGSKHTQFYSMLGTRGIWHDGWFASTVHPPADLGDTGPSRLVPLRPPGTRRSAD